MGAVIDLDPAVTGKLRLTERQKTILRMSYAPGEHKAYTDEEIGAAIGLSRMHVYRERRAAFRVITRHFKAFGHVDLSFLQD
jgi:DNA-directed RNA polymerase specialized sigma subunit